MPFFRFGAGRRAGRRRVAARIGAGAVGLALVAQLAGPGIPAYADVATPTLAEMRDFAVGELADGGPSARRAAEAALLGTDADLTDYFNAGAQTAVEADEKASVQVLAAMDGATLRTAAVAVLDKSPEEIEAFVYGGWRDAWAADERQRVYRALAAGGPTVKAAANKALAGTTSIDTFLTSERAAAEAADARIAATAMLTGGANNSGPVLNTAAQAALAGSPEGLRDFLDQGQFVSRARDAELASIRSLTEQAKEAGETTSREALAAEESSTRAGNAAAEAKRAALAAKAEAIAAGGDARKASAAAGRAADAAQGAAEAAGEAIAASNAAMRAARRAADASRKATTAAALTAQAASRAQRAAAAARLNAGDAQLASDAAVAARDAAKLARELEQVKAERDRALEQAAVASLAAKNAGLNAKDAANAADEAGQQAGVSGQQAARARKAAEQARKAAATADRAADRAESLARQAKTASDQAFGFATRAAAHAEKAVTDAEAAAAAARRGEISATEAAKHAQSAVDAANVAVEAANQAVQVADLARQEDEDRRAEWTEQGIQAAQTAVEAEQQNLATGGELAAWNRSLRWDTAEQDRIDAATRTLLAEATAAGASDSVLRDRSRRAAAALITTGGEWSRQAATDALGGDDAELRLWLTENRQAAVGQDDRARTWRLVDTLPDGLEKTAAQTALNGDDAAVETFLRTRNYAGKVAADRTQIYAILKVETGPNVTRTGNDALLLGTGAALHEFLRSGVDVARAADARLEAFAVMGDAAAGPEVKAAAQVALSGPASYLTYFLTTGRYEAAQRDLEQAAHVETVQKLIAEAQQYAQKALEDADRAVEAAKRAQGYAADANAAKVRADAAAVQASTYAGNAATSAAAAKKSADQAAQSAVTARAASDKAQASATSAARSAATATAASQRAQADAYTAYQAKRAARASADAAGKDAATAAQAAKEASQIYITRLKQAELDRRSTAPGSGPDGTGTAADNHKTWGCLTLDASSVSKECLSVFQDFAGALIDPAKCNTPANAGAAGCAMLADLQGFVKENADLMLDMLSFTLMACGLVPGAGEVCDAIDAAVSFGRGDWAGGLLSMGSAIPILGWGAAGLKALKNADKFRSVQKIIDKLKGLGGSCKIPNSFAAGTLVRLAGGRTRPIEQVRAGDRVTATDPVGGRTVAKPVLALIAAYGVKHLVDIKVDDDGQARTAPVLLTATADHLFWIPASRAWVPARSLAAGTALRQQNGRPVVVTGIAERTETTRVYNLSVADLHTYYVMAGSASVLTHNEDVPAIPCLPKVGDIPGKVVNSNMGHIDPPRAARGGFTSVKAAGDAIRALSVKIKGEGFPAGTIPDTAHTDRVLVPLNDLSYAVYQIKPNGNAVFKTLLEKRG